ncbi:hypothetical protein SDC9_142881 [bioreactor metagenome]|uniref:Uncharacterized protein n=1 Tax=bioreactor metagenome TaxID=1076179 RepID=A0A645E2D6_9ZZZZ|nr:hypothetical protein [Cloacibacillus evryensis]MEA5034210.1 hypothetical protein [Cloacibacillus evryensis]
MTYLEKYKAAIKIDKELLTPQEAARAEKVLDPWCRNCPGDIFTGAPVARADCHQKITCRDCWNQDIPTCSTHIGG